MGTFATPPVSTALSSIAFCQAAGTAISQVGRVVGGGAAGTVAVLVAARSATDPPEHDATATVRTATTTAPAPARSATWLTSGH